MDFWIVCGLALLVGFVVGRWWAIAAVGLGWTIYALVVIPQHIVFYGEEAGLGRWLENAQYANVFLTVVVLGGATAIGFGCRLMSRATRS
jgi:isoprenylcysteine carboxyl methyltransferase (ICMT) family protein YpbQ